MLFTSAMLGQWTWPKWCHAATARHSHVCWEWSGPGNTGKWSKEQIKEALVEEFRFNHSQHASPLDLLLIGPSWRALFIYWGVSKHKLWKMNLEPLSHGGKNRYNHIGSETNLLNSQRTNGLFIYDYTSQTAKPVILVCGVNFPVCMYANNSSKNSLGYDFSPFTLL